MPGLGNIERIGESVGGHHTGCRRPDAGSPCRGMSGPKEKEKDALFYQDPEKLRGPKKFEILKGEQSGRHNELRKQGGALSIEKK